MYAPQTFRPLTFCMFHVSPTKVYFHLANTLWEGRKDRRKSLSQKLKGHCVQTLRKKKKFLSSFTTSLPTVYVSRYISGDASHWKKRKAEKRQKQNSPIVEKRIISYIHYCKSCSNIYYHLIPAVVNTFVFLRKRRKESVVDRENATGPLTNSRIFSSDLETPMRFSFLFHRSFYKIFQKPSIVADTWKENYPWIKLSSYISLFHN